MPKKITPDGEIINTVEHKTIPQAGPFWKTPWNHDRDAESNSVALTCLDPSKTQQQFLKDADINVILAKFKETGELPQISGAIYQDIQDFVDLQDTIVTRSQVDLAWNKLSAEVRNTLKDPETFARYYEHCVTTGDLEPLYELGLEPRPEPPKPPSPPGGVSPAPPAAAGAPSAPITAPTGASTDTPK